MVSALPVLFEFYLLLLLHVPVVGLHYLLELAFLYVVVLTPIMRTMHTKLIEVQQLRWRQVTEKARGEYYASSGTGTDARPEESVTDGARKALSDAVNVVKEKANYFHNAMREAAGNYGSK